MFNGHDLCQEDQAEHPVDDVEFTVKLFDFGLSFF